MERSDLSAITVSAALDVNNGDSLRILGDRYRVLKCESSTSFVVRPWRWHDSLAVFGYRVWLLLTIWRK